MRQQTVDRPAVGALTPHPRWRWGSYPLRWLIGGLWGLWRRPLPGLLYGGVFACAAYLWDQTVLDFTAQNFAMATALTGLTLLLTPPLTAGLFNARRASIAPRSFTERQYAEERDIGLGVIGVLLVLILVLTLNGLLVCFTLLFNGDVPALETLHDKVFSWGNAPLVLAMALVVSIGVLGMQGVAMIPTILMSERSVDLVDAMHANTRTLYHNWRPLVCWALASQALLFVFGGLLPVTVLVLAPLLAHGSWWACRETALQRPVATAER